MASQPIDDESSFLIKKKNLQKWKSVTSHALKSKTEFTTSLQFIDVDGETQSISVKADQPLMNALWNCIHDDDDDNIIEMNNMYCKIKFNTEQIIQFRKARGTHIKVRFCFCAFCLCVCWFCFRLCYYS
jgi:hypothetical protein